MFLGTTSGGIDKADSGVNAAQVYIYIYIINTHATRYYRLHTWSTKLYHRSETKRPGQNNYLHFYTFPPAHSTHFSLLRQLSTKIFSSFLFKFVLKTSRKKNITKDTFLILTIRFSLFLFLFRSLSPLHLCTNFKIPIKKHKRVASTGWAWSTWAFVWCSPLCLAAVLRDSTRPIPNPVRQHLPCRYILSLSFLCTLWKQEKLLL